MARSVRLHSCTSELRQAKVLEARDFANSVAWNNGNGTFTRRPLAVEAQFAPVYASLAEDFDRDGHVDLLLGGNFYGVPPVLGRYDASYGTLLRGAGGRSFQNVDPEASGLVLEGQVRHIRALRQAGGKQLIVVARNNAQVQVIRPTRW